MKIGAVIAGILVLLVGFGIWRNYLFFSKVRRAHITVDGRECSQCAFYLDRIRVDGVLVIRREGQVEEVYSVMLPNGDFHIPEDPLWKCKTGAFWFGFGFALEFISDYGVWPWSDPDARPKGDKRIEVGFIEFTADDGKRVRVEW
jgi:hypothetical protein